MTVGGNMKMVAVVTEPFRLLPFERMILLSVTSSSYHLCLSDNLWTVFGFFYTSSLKLIHQIIPIYSLFLIKKLPKVSFLLNYCSKLHEEKSVYNYIVENLCVAVDKKVKVLFKYIVQS